MVKKQQKFGENPVNWAFHEKTCYCRFQPDKTQNRSAQQMKLTV